MKRTLSNRATFGAICSMLRGLMMEANNQGGQGNSEIEQLQRELSAARERVNELQAEVSRLEAVVEHAILSTTDRHVEEFLRTNCPLVTLNQNAAPGSGGQSSCTPDSQESPAAGHCPVAAPEPAAPTGLPPEPDMVAITRKRVKEKFGLNGEVACLAYADELRSAAEALQRENADLRHDIGRHVKIAADLATESSTLRADHCEWLCEVCSVIHPHQKTGFLQLCPDCGSAMVPTSKNIREIKALRAKLAEAEKGAARYCLLRDTYDWKVFADYEGAELDSMIDIAINAAKERT